MAPRFFTLTKKKLLTGVSGMKLDGDLRLALVMTNTTVDTADIDTTEFLDDFTLDECDGAGYARIALAASTPSVVVDATRSSVKLICDDHPVFPNLDPGTRNIQGVLVYINVLADDSQSVPLFYIPYTTPRVPDGGDFTIELPVVSAQKLLFEFMHVADDTTPIAA